MGHVVSVIIPTHGRPEKLCKCLAAISKQVVPAGVEVEIIVAIDGGEGDDSYRLNGVGRDVRVLSLPVGGVCAARNAAIEIAGGELLLFTNDDTYPDPHWVREHLGAQAQRGRPGMVMGLTRWLDGTTSTVFDALIRETSMIFFFDRMKAGRSYGFRHFWTSNASVPSWMARQVGGFDERIRPYLYDDLEFAFRLENMGHSGVYFHPNAVNSHDHPLTWDAYCRRETCLGRMAACLAEVNPACFEAIFGFQDATEVHARFREWLSLDREEHAETEALLRQWSERPSAALADWPRIREMLYRLHLPIKRRCFRAGFVEGFELRDDARWRERLVLGHSFP